MFYFLNKKKAETGTFKQQKIDSLLIARKDKKFIEIELLSISFFGS